MVEQVRHRGPDTTEIYDDLPHGIAACRLSIFGDEQAPMAFRDPITGQGRQ